MKKQTPLKVAFWGNAVLIIFMFLMGVEIFPILPFMLFCGVVASMIWDKKDYKVGAIVIAGLMILVSFYAESDIDSLAWLISLILVIL